MKKINFKNIKVKLLIWYSSVIFFILLFASIILVYIFTNQNIKTVDTQLMAVIHDVDYSLSEIYNNEEEFDEEEEFKIKNLNIFIYEYIDGAFKFIRSSDKKIRDFDRKNIEKETWEFLTVNEERVVRYHSSKITKKQVYIEATTTLADKLDRALNSLISTLFILVPVILIISIFLGYFIIKTSLKTVKSVIDEVKQLEVEQLDKRIKSLDSDDEIEELIDTFNNMLSKIEDSVDKIKRFSNDVSHELKTPLTVIRGEIELGLRKDRSVDEYKEILKSSLDETKQLQDLIDNLLFLSTSNIVEMKEKFVTIDLDEIVFDSILENQHIAKKKDIHILCTEIESFSVLGNRLLIKILIGNILKNSIKYSNNSSNIEISLKDAVLTIKDYGIGIGKEELKYIFDRFYRVDSSRGRGGYGLGLSIVKSIADLHNYKIDVNSELGKYTAFNIYFK